MVVKPTIYLNNKKAVHNHYLKNNDFIILDIFNGHGRHINKQDCEKYQVNHLEIRYGKDNRKALVINP